MNPEYQIATNLTYKNVIEKTEHFTFPPIRKKIRTIPLHEPFTGAWAAIDNKMVGLVLADKNKQDIAELFSFLVIPKQRNKGIGNQLLTLLESTLQQQGIKWVQTRYRTDWKSLPYIEKLLHANEWEEPKLLRIIVETDIDKYHVAPWPTIKLSSEYSLFHWGELTNRDRDEIDQLMQRHEVPGEFNPYQHEDKIFLPGSIGMRFRDRLIGWNIVYSLHPDTIEYNNLFIRKEFQNFGHAITLLHRSFGEQYKLNIPKATWVINANNPVVMKICTRIAGKYVSKIIEVKISRKILNEP